MTNYIKCNVALISADEKETEQSSEKFMANLRKYKKIIIVLVSGVALGISLLAIANYSYLTQKNPTTKIEITDEEIAKQSWTYGCTNKTVRAARVAPDVIGDETVATEIAQMYCGCYFQEMLDHGVTIEEMLKELDNPQSYASRTLDDAKNTCYEKYNQ